MALAHVLSLLVVAFVGLRLWAGPSAFLLGSPGAEVYGHAWVQGWVADAWPTLPAEIDSLNPPDRTSWRVIDPAVTWLAAGLAQVVGTILAYNLVLLGSVLLAWWGGWHLARRLGGDPYVGAVALALAPSYLGSLASGLTEDACVGLVALALAHVGTRNTREAVAAGLLLGLTTWVGLYLALMAAMGASLLGVAALIRDRRLLLPLAVSAALALLVAMPPVVMQGGRLGGVGHRAGAPKSERPEPHWRVNPHRGADLASLVVPGPDPVDDDALIRIHPAYLGFSLIGLGLLSGRRRLEWMVLVGGTVLLVTGPEIRVAGQWTGVTNPVAAGLAELPGFRLLNHWGRLMLLVHLGLAAVAAVGAARLARTRPVLRVVLPVVVGLELWLASPGGPPLPITDARVPEVYRRLDGLPEGGVLVVPSAGPHVAFQRPLLYQRAHGRPLFLHPNRPGYGRAEGTPLVRWFASLPGERKDPPEPRREESLARLRALGVGVIVVDEIYVDDVREVLGAPDVETSDGAAWGVR